MSKILLTKYPVKSLSGIEYRVDIVKEYVAVGLYTLIGKVYSVKMKKTIFNNEKLKMKRVHEFYTGWEDYDEWMGKYVDLAITAVASYECKILKEIEHEKKNKEGINEWTKWDGNFK